MNITIISTLNKVVYINLPKFDDYLFFANLFESNDKGEILRIQIANNTLKSKIKLFDKLSKTNKRYLQLKSFFTEIPDNSKFAVLPGKIDDSNYLLFLKQEIINLNYENKTSKIDYNTIAEMSSLYYTQSFEGTSNHNIYIGDSDKNKRICRFCKKGINETTFRNKSHAISESLGNKNLICNEECDICNEKFSKEIEPDIANMLSFLLTTNSIHGKNGIRTTKGKNFEFSHNNTTKWGNKTGYLEIKLNQNFTGDIKRILHKKMELDTSVLKYTPQNVYKCLCKYVISVIKDEYLPNFTETINWINNKNTTQKLPKVAIGNTNCNLSSPHLLVSVRKGNNVQYPYCFAVLAVANIAFAFIMPFAKNDKYKFIMKSKYIQFETLVKSWYKGISWSLKKMSSISPTHTPIKFSIKMSSECKLGKDYFIIKK